MDVHGFGLTSSCICTYARGTWARVARLMQIRRRTGYATLFDYTEL